MRLHWNSALSVITWVIMGSPTILATIVQTLRKCTETDICNEQLLYLASCQGYAKMQRSNGMADATGTVLADYPANTF